MAEIGFIGMGNMGFAMLKGALKLFAKENLLFTDVNRDRMEVVKQETGVEYAESNAECANRVKYIVLSVKPQYYDQVLHNLMYTLTENHIVITIAPGISIDSIQKKIGTEKRVIRVMPNTPALVSEGMSGVSYDASRFSMEELAVVNQFLCSFGKVEVIEERLMNAVVCASGSSPAYVYMFIEALADSAVKYGIPREKAYEFAAQTVKGSAEMVMQTKLHPGVLKDQVCSPGGTTIAGVAALEEYGFRNAVIKAGDACYKKCVDFQ